MTPLIQCKNLDFSVGGPLLLNKATFTIHSGDRIGLIGRNGAGKSTLLKLLYGIHQPDDGELIFQSGLKVGRLIQEVPSDTQGTVASVIASGHITSGELLSNYFREQSHNNFIEDSTQNAMTELDLWSDVNNTQTLISKFDLNPETQFSDLSGGMKRRVLLARSLINNPQLLLLDEPTNHLDINTIKWLEDFLSKTPITLIIVSHDRAFLNKLCKSILEVDRGQVSRWEGNYDYYQVLKAKALEEEARHHAKFDKKLAEEEAWIRQGIKARRTRNEGRVRALKDMRNQRSERREQQGKANFKLQEQDNSGKRVIKARDIHVSFEDKIIINDFSINIVRGDKVGIIGDNGCGKSTLIKVLTGAITPNTGTIKLGTNLEIAYLDQMRSDINQNLSVLDNISSGKEFIEIDGKSRHAISYAQDFLFSPAKARGPVNALSGGERNRLLLAKLFTKPCNLLILDEPTNDLDMETLELLENLLVDYQGTLLLVSHDREFLNNVVTSTIVFEGTEKNPGQINDYIGGYDDWLRQSSLQKKNNKNAHKNSVNEDTPSKNINKLDQQSAKKKLSYKDQRELDSLPKSIEELEEKISILSTEMNQPDFYQRDKTEITQANTDLHEYQTELNHCYLRWEELEQ